MIYGVTKKRVEIKPGVLVNYVIDGNSFAEINDLRDWEQREEKQERIAYVRFIT